MNRLINVTLPLVLFILTPVLLVSCVSTPKQKPSSFLQQAERRNLTGVNAEAQGKLIAAESEFLEAHRLFSSVENFHGMVLTLINSSRVNRKIGDSEKADAAIDYALNLSAHTPELEAEVYFEKAKSLLQKTSLDDSEFWAGKAVKAAGEKDRPRMLNFLASIYLKKGMLLNVKENATAAEKLARSLGEKREEGNSLRILAEAALLEKRLTDSLILFQTALLLDKEVAVSIRVSDDLRGMGRVYELLGDNNTAALSFKRSAAINVAGKEFRRAEEDLDQAVRIYMKAGDDMSASDARGSLEKLRSSRSQAGQN